MSVEERANGTSFRDISVSGSAELEPLMPIAVPNSPFSERPGHVDFNSEIGVSLPTVDSSTLVAVDTESNHGRQGWITECLLWFASIRTFCRRRQYQSGYIVLFTNSAEIPGGECFLSDPRLKPRLPKLLIAFLVLLSLGGILCVYFLVPRGVTLVDPRLEVVEFTLSTSNQTYTLVVDVYLPFHNPNYVSVDVSGNVQMTYYQATAGVNNKNFTLHKRATTNVSVTVNASNVPLKFISTVFQHCYSFPYQVVFFVDGTFKAKYLLQSQNLTVDSYKYINCPRPYHPNISFAE